MHAEALVEATAGPVNGLGAKFYFHPDSLAKGKEAGLDGFRLYSGLAFPFLFLTLLFLLLSFLATQLHRRSEHG